MEVLPKNLVSDFPSRPRGSGVVYNQYRRVWVHSASGEEFTRLEVDDVNCHFHGIGPERAIEFILRGRMKAREEKAREELVHKEQERLLEESMTSCHFPAWEATFGGPV